MPADQEKLNAESISCILLAEEDTAMQTKELKRTGGQSERRSFSRIRLAVLHALPLSALLMAVFVAAQTDPLEMRQEGHFTDPTATQTATLHVRCESSDAAQSADGGQEGHRDCIAELRIQGEDERQVASYTVAQWEDRGDREREWSLVSPLTAPPGGTDILIASLRSLSLLEELDQGHTLYLIRMTGGEGQELFELRAARQELDRNEPHTLGVQSDHFYSTSERVLLFDKHGDLVSRPPARALRAVARTTGAILRATAAPLEAEVDERRGRFSGSGDGETLRLVRLLSSESGQWILPDGETRATNQRVDLVLSTADGAELNRWAVFEFQQSLRERHTWALLDSAHNSEYDRDMFSYLHTSWTDKTLVQECWIQVVSEGELQTVRMHERGTRVDCDLDDDDIDIDVEHLYQDRLESEDDSCEVYPDDEMWCDSYAG